MIDNYEDILVETVFLPAERIVLRNFKLSDEEDIFEYGSDPETLEFLVWDGLKTIEDAKNTIINYYLINPGIFAIELKESKKCIGAIDLRIKQEHDKASFGYVLNKNYWNRGYMSEALMTLLDFSFNTLQFNRIESDYFAGNPGSGKVMEKCGMKKEGFGIEEVKVKGIFRDVIHYGIIKKDWDKFGIHSS